MAYARFGVDGSSVYVFACREGIECCKCVLESHSYVTADADEFLRHLARRRSAAVVLGDSAA